MSKLIELFKKYFNKYKELIMYVFFGGMTTIVNWIVFFPLRYLLEAYWPSLGSFWPGVGSQLRVQIANVVSWCAAVIFAYYTNKKYVFRSKTETKEESLKEFEGFVGARFLSLIIESVWLVVGVSVLHIGENISKIVGAVVVVIFNYVAGKLFIFNDKSAEGNKFVKFFNEKFIPAVFTKIPTFKHITNMIPRYLVRIAGILAVAATPLYCYLTAEYFHFSDSGKYLSFLQNSRESVLFGLSVIYLLYTIVLLIVKKGWIASIAASASMSAIAIADYARLTLTGNSLSPHDLISSGALLDFTKTGLPIKYILLLSAALLFAVIAFLAKTDVPIRWYVRIPAALIIALCMIFSVSSAQKTNKVIASHNLYASGTSEKAQEIYDHNGFTSTFIINVIDR